MWANAPNARQQSAGVAPDDAQCQAMLIEPEESVLMP